MNQDISVLLIQLFQLFNLLLIVYVLGSWIPALRGSKAYSWLESIFRPLLEPIRKIIPPIGGAIDISPIILILAVSLLRNLILSLV